jgi:hypothetical protein
MKNLETAKKFTLAEIWVVLFGLAVCGIAVAASVEPGYTKLTISNTTVAVPVSATSKTAGEYTVFAGANNTGKICVGDSTVTTANTDACLNAGDTETQDKYGHDYKLDKLYVIGDTLNDTVTVKYTQL